MPRRVDCSCLPCQKQAAMEDDSKRLVYIARLIQADPGLSACLIKIANPPPCIIPTVSCRISGASLPDVLTVWPGSGRMRD
jgi:hypothetical protein